MVWSGGCSHTPMYGLKKTMFRSRVQQWVNSHMLIFLHVFFSFFLHGCTLSKNWGNSKDLASHVLLIWSFTRMYFVLIHTLLIFVCFLFFFCCSSELCAFEPLFHSDGPLNWDEFSQWLCLFCLLLGSHGQFCSGVHLTAGVR